MTSLRRLLIFPKGNRQQESLSVFLECLDAKVPEKLPERWHKCVHFALGIANSEDNAIQKNQRRDLCCCGPPCRSSSETLGDTLARLADFQMPTTGTAQRKATGDSTR
jgi:hypothetical protein